MGTVDDIGLCCVFLCSEAGGWISGDSTHSRTHLHHVRSLTSVDLLLLTAIQVDGAGQLRRGVARNDEGLSGVDRAAIAQLSRDRERDSDKAGGFAQTGLPCASPGARPLALAHAPPLV